MRGKKYFKVLPSYMNLDGVDYHLGLNQLCEGYMVQKEGATIYSDYYLPYFFDQGAVICDVEIPEGATVKEDVIWCMTDQLILTNMRHLLDIHTIKELEKDNVNIHGNDEFLFQMACKGGNFRVVKYLVDEAGTDIHASNDYALKLACFNNQIDIIQYLLSLDNDFDLHIFNDVLFKATSKKVRNYLYSADKKTNIFKRTYYRFLK